MIVDRNLSLRSVTASVRLANLVFFAWALAVTLAYRRFGSDSLSFSPTPFTILGAGITIFLGFRTNTAYDRWWEARTLWGGIVNQSRTLVRQALLFTGTDGDNAGDTVPSAFARSIAYRQVAFVNAMRAHLRRQDALAATESYLSTDDRTALAGVQNVPAALLQRMGDGLRRAYAEKRIDSIQQSVLDGTLTELTNLLGGCERIKNTPLPRQYDTVPQLAIYAYSVLLPLGLVSSLAWWTPFISSLITFLFIAIDSIGSNIEDPFESGIHDVPMTSLCRTIEINLREMLGEKEIPTPIEPRHGILL